MIALDRLKFQAKIFAVMPLSCSLCFGLLSKRCSHNSSKATTKSLFFCLS